MSLDIKRFFIDNNITGHLPAPPITQFQLSQLLIKYSRMVVDECEKEVKLWEDSPNSSPTGWLKDHIRAIKLSIK